MSYRGNHSVGNRELYRGMITALEAHELTHLLIDGNHLESPANVLGDPTTGSMALSLTPAQCDRVRMSHLVVPLPMPPAEI